MPRIDRKFHASPLATAESGNLVYENSRDRAQAFVRIFNLSRDLFLQFRVISDVNIFESPECAVQSRQRLFSKTKLHHLIDVPIASKITYITFQKVAKVFMPPVT